MKRTIRLITSVFVASTALLGTAFGADFPTKPITIIVPYSVGGSMDIQTRGIAPYLGKALNTNVLVENVTGASGVLGFNKGFKAAADGYTLVANNLPAIVITELSQPNANYKTKDFLPLAAFARDSVVVITHPDLYKTFDEFVAAAKTQSVRVGVTGKGTTVHLAGLILENALNVKFNFIPFGGGSESVTALAGKHIDAVITIASSANAMIRAGRIRALVILANERNSNYAQVPTPKELGYNIPPFSNHTGVLAPPGLAPDRLKVLLSAFEQAVKDPDYVQWMEKGVAEYAPLVGKDYQTDIERVTKIVEGYRDLLK